MKKLVFTAIILCSLSSSFAQTKLKYETIFFGDESVENATARVALTSAVSESEFIKAKVKVSNFTSKALVVKPEECSYTTPQGELFSKDKWMVIAPHQDETKVIDVKGDNLKTDATTFKFNGFYICNTVEIITAADMTLPPAKELIFGNFSLKLDDYDKDGREVMMRYKIRYLGTKVGLFTPGKVLLKSPDGAEYKNQKEKDKVFAFKKNEDFLIGFLYLSDSKKDNIILWKDAFSESTPEKLENITVDLKMDLGKTKEKN